jgi:hypothetical protein
MADHVPDIADRVEDKCPGCSQPAFGPRQLNRDLVVVCDAFGRRAPDLPPYNLPELHSQPIGPRPSESPPWRWRRSRAQLSRAEWAVRTLTSERNNWLGFVERRTRAELSAVVSTPLGPSPEY